MKDILLLIRFDDNAPYLPILIKSLEKLDLNKMKLR